MKYIKEGNIDGALLGASTRWASLPQSRDKGGRYKQKYLPYDEVVTTFELNRAP